MGLAVYECGSSLSIKKSAMQRSMLLGEQKGIREK